MKKLFPGYVLKSESDIVRILNEGLIVFDAKVLLNLYRYSESTTNALFEIIEKFSERVYLPHQAAFDYNRNRIDVILQQYKVYEHLQKNLNDILVEIQSDNKQPFLSPLLKDKIEASFEEIQAEVVKSKKRFERFIYDDPIFERIDQIFTSRISNSYDDERMKKIYQEGKKRYEKQIPPGFEQKSEIEEVKYADLVFWKQIMDISKYHNKDILLVTDDYKPDWIWMIEGNRTIGPRAELVEELHRYSKRDFHIYSSKNFMEYGSSVFSLSVTADVLNEIQEINENLNSKLIQDYEGLRNKLLRKKNIITELKHIDKEITSIKNEIGEIDQKSNVIKLNTEEGTSELSDTKYKLIELIKNLN
ncbi:PIN-like domain-containing protein [Gynurincola endophyticus]|jgi:hypothetical protein|uniref:PIN-like domain-containing protein n=1 Tax=Gynurincola endophyticus TaxID=2479004 RepID=UPI000F8DA533|nr:PIN-like domain-containing protein [Gynurincola endophyticus]